MRVLALSIALFILAGGGQTVGQVPVPSAGCYHSAFTPYDPSKGAYGHQDFIALAQKNIAIEMFYAGWPAGMSPDFPASTCNDIVLNGSVPHITWEPWVVGFPYPLDGIIGGLYDTYIIGYAVQTKNWGKPLFLRPGHEMNGDWYPWGGKNNGGSTLNGYGDPAKADGPERFVAAFRHVRHLFDSVGVRNVSWVWCPNNGSSPNETWNRPENYYPGNDVVDWIGIDLYNWGSTQTWSYWTSYFNLLKDVYNLFKTYGKPMMIAEYASAEDGGSKAQWISDAYLYTKAVFPQIKAITWFNINKETDWRINSTPAALQAYQTAISDPYYLSSVVSTAVNENPPAVEGKDFTLAPPYPNPFNGSITIPFVVPVEGVVSVEICNVLGQKVRQIFNTPLSGGRHAASWDGTDDNHRTVTSGVYIVRLRSREMNAFQRIMYLK
jgi:hypothetical protein